MFLPLMKSPEVLVYPELGRLSVVCQGGTVLLCQGPILPCLVEFLCIPVIRGEGDGMHVRVLYLLAKHVFKDLAPAKQSTLLWKYLINHALTPNLVKSLRMMAALR